MELLVPKPTLKFMIVDALADLIAFIGVGGGILVFFLVNWSQGSIPLGIVSALATYGLCFALRKWLERMNDRGAAAYRLATAHLCPKCGYDRTGLSQDAKCPECGSTPS